MQRSSPVLVLPGLLGEGVGIDAQCPGISGHDKGNLSFPATGLVHSAFEFHNPVNSCFKTRPAGDTA